MKRLTTEYAIKRVRFGRTLQLIVKSAILTMEILKQLWQYKRILDQFDKIKVRYVMTYDQAVYVMSLFPGTYIEDTRGHKSMVVNGKSYFLEESIFQALLASGQIRKNGPWWVRIAE